MTEDVKKPYEEYSYFRAGGMAIVAVETVEKSRARFAKTLLDLRKSFNAMAVVGTTKAKHGYGFECVIFEGSAAPEGWRQAPAIQSNDMHFCVLPPAGSAAEAKLAAAEMLIRRDQRRSSLEKVFGCGDMPPRPLAAGSYSKAFVRDRTWLAAFQGWPAGKRGDNHGYLDEQPSNGLMGSGSACSMADPLHFLQLKDACYIRVPNDADGNPVFTPPDSVKIALSDMLDIDRRAWIDRQTRATPLRPPSVH